MVKDGSYKKGNKITALDYIRGIVIDFEDNNPIVKLLEQGMQKVFIVEKEKVDGNTAVCNLASVNLSRINSEKDLERVIPIAVRMLDNVIDLNFYPLRKVKMTNLKTRAIGLGVMGEAQMIAEKKIHFGSQEHFNLIDEVMEQFSYYTIKASSDLAVEKGAYPDFNGSNWSKGIMPFHHAKDEVNEITEFSRIPNDFADKYTELIEKVKKDGIEPVYKRKWY